MGRRRDFRDPDDVQAILLRMGKHFVDMLDKMCEVDDRSRRQLVEQLIREEYSDRTRPQR